MDQILRQVADGRVTRTQPALEKGTTSETVLIPYTPYRMKIYRGNGFSLQEGGAPYQLVGEVNAHQGNDG